MKNLKHGDKVILNGRKGTVGTVGGCYGNQPSSTAETIKEAFERAERNKHDLYWINQEAAVLCGDPGYYEREKARWMFATHLKDGDLVWLEGKVMRVIYKGDYSDMGAFEEVWPCSKK